eukprot:PhF_6_TR43323/c1_g1_i1/m.66212
MMNRFLFPPRLVVLILWIVISTTVPSNAATISGLVKPERVVSADVREGKSSAIVCIVTPAGTFNTSVRPRINTKDAETNATTVIVLSDAGDTEHGFQKEMKRNPFLVSGWVESTRMCLRLGADQDFRAYVEESIQVVILKKQWSNGMTPYPRAFTFTIEQEVSTLAIYRNYFEVVLGVISLVLSVLCKGNPSGVLMFVRLGMLARVHECTSDLDFLLHPTRVSLGTDYWDNYYGCLIVNYSIFLLIYLIHAFVLLWISRHEAEEESAQEDAHQPDAPATPPPQSSDKSPPVSPTATAKKQLLLMSRPPIIYNRAIDYAMGRHHFPSVHFNVAWTLGVGMMISGLQLVYYNVTPLRFALGLLLFLLYVLCLCGSITFLLFYFEENTVYEVVEGKHYYGLWSSKPGCRMPNLLQSWACCLEPYKGEKCKYIVYFVLSTLVMAAINSIQPTQSGPAGCRVRAILTFVVVFCDVFAVFYANPYNSYIEQRFNETLNICQFLVGLFALIETYVDDPDSWAEYTAELFAILMYIIISLKYGYETYLMHYLGDSLHGGPRAGYFKGKAIMMMSPSSPNSGLSSSRALGTPKGDSLTPFMVVDPAAHDVEMQEASSHHHHHKGKGGVPPPLPLSSSSESGIVHVKTGDKKFTL